MYELSWRRPKPPRNDLGLVVRIVHARPGITFNELLVEGLFASELTPTLRQLVAMGEIRREGAAFYPRQRRSKKPEPVAPGLWSRLRAVFRGTDPSAAVAPPLEAVLATIEPADVVEKFNAAFGAESLRVAT